MSFARYLYFLNLEFSCVCF